MLLITVRHTLRGCVDWNININNTRPTSNSHTLRGCVDWNSNIIEPHWAPACHTLRGCVDWNCRDMIKHKKLNESHPAWVCGLKLVLLLLLLILIRHTLRGCVDWNLAYQKIYYDFFSHTLRGCVDWNRIFLLRCILLSVTPCVGVWIETFKTPIEGKIKPVTPCVGVWIETENRDEVEQELNVTPCVGVWIETSISNNENVADMSHPAWVCGLKPCMWNSLFFFACHTLRGCVDWNTYL